MTETQPRCSHSSHRKSLCGGGKIQFWGWTPFPCVPTKKTVLFPRVLEKIAMSFWPGLSARARRLDFDKSRSQQCELACSQHVCMRPLVVDSFLHPLWSTLCTCGHFIIHLSLQKKKKRTWLSRENEVSRRLRGSLGVETIVRRIARAI